MQVSLFDLAEPKPSHDYRIGLDRCPDCGDEDFAIFINHPQTFKPGWCGKRLFLTARARGHVTKTPVEQLPDFVWSDIAWLQAHGYELEDRFGETPTIPYPIMPAELVR